MSVPQPGTNVVVMSPSLSDEKRETCLELQHAGSPAGLDVLCVSYSASPTELVDEWRDQHGQAPRADGHHRRR